jgi:hypothetical protein
VKKDLDAYVCVFDNCAEPHRLYSSSEEWLAHMSAQHRTTWHCTARDHQPISFEAREQLIEHMEGVHPGRFKKGQLGFIADSCARALSPTILNCPFCSESAENFNLHVRQHLHYFALQSLPWPEDSMQDAGQVSTDEAEDSSDSDGLDRATLRDSFEDTPQIHDSKSVPQVDLPTSRRFKAPDVNRYGLEIKIHDVSSRRGETVRIVHHPADSTPPDNDEPKSSDYRPNGRK